MRFYIYISIFFLYNFQTVNSQVYTPEDSLIFEDYRKEVWSVDTFARNVRFIKAAEFFLGKPYISNSLDDSLEERLTINLREFDCTTFIESCLALTLATGSENPTFKNFCHYLKKIRYRKGEIVDYSSRLHYMSEWIKESENNNWLKNVTNRLGGEWKNKTINYMSTHPKYYLQLAASEILQKKIKENENILNKTGGYYVIDKKEIKNIGGRLINGDIVLFSTTIPGLDFSHAGVIYKDEKQVTFIHASSRVGKVVVEEQSIHSYCQNIKSCDGIVILRLKNR